MKNEGKKHHYDSIPTSIPKLLDIFHHGRIFSMATLHPQVAFSAALATLATAAPHAPIRLLTWNLRYDSQPNSISVEDTIASLPEGMPMDSGVKYYDSPVEMPWSTRRIAVANDVIFNRVDILGTLSSSHVFWDTLDLTAINSCTRSIEASSYRPRSPPRQ